MGFSLRGCWLHRQPHVLELLDAGEDVVVVNGWGCNPRETE
jgi:hypothetical protein